MKKNTLNPFDYRCRTNGLEINGFEIPSLYSENKKAIRNFKKLGAIGQELFCKLMWKAASIPTNEQRNQFWSEINAIVTLRMERVHEK